MSKRGFLMVVFLVACAAAVPAFDPSELNKITFRNTTGKNIQNIFLSPSDSEEWGPEILGADYHLPDGGSMGYFVHYPGSSFKFDILAMDEKGNAFELDAYTMTDSKEATITFTKKNLKDEPPDLDFIRLNVKNATDYDMHYLFISPSDSDAWGVDLLGEDTILSTGDTYSIVIAIGSSKVTYNVMSADEDGDLYKFDITFDPSKGHESNVSIEPNDLE